MLRRLLLNPIYYTKNTFNRLESSSISENAPKISLNEYQDASDSSLEELSERLESILEDRYDSGADVSLSSGVLTFVVDSENTYVINKQTPNKQLWLSSPLSGPKRFDLVSGRWIDRQTKTELKGLLSEELSQILKSKNADSFLESLAQTEIKQQMVTNLSNQ